jgi:hypothetical protein
MNEDKLIEILPGEHYDIHVKECSLGLEPNEPPIIMRQCHTKEGYYIGDEKIADFLTIKKGLTQLQPLQESNNVCSIGFNEAEDKWYGWSHRAIFGFGVGSEVKPGDCAFKPATKEQWLDKLIEWADGLDNLSTLTWNSETQECSYTKKGSKIGTVEKFEPEHLGNGEWRAGNLDHAKQMAIEFAQSVSATIVNDFTSMSSSRVVFNPHYGPRPLVKRIKISLRE